MRLRTAALLAAVSSLLLVASTAAGGQDISWEMRPATGDAPAAMIITARKNVSEMTIRLVRTTEDGEQEEMVLRPLIRRGRNVVPLPRFDGSVRWRGTLRVTFADGTGGEAPLDLHPTTVAPMNVRSDATKDEVMARRVVMFADQPVARARVRVTGDYGRQLADTTVDLGGAPPNTPLEIAWEQSVEGDPLVISVMLHSVSGSERGIQWMPWQISVPHETVVFDTGRSEIRADQVPKLQGVLTELNETLRRYGTAVKQDTGRDVALWVVGHTDTVGSRETNRRLSEARARSIASWFRQAGVTAPIHFRGMGQEALLVRTPDNIDEPRNRRAEYIVSVNAPYEGQNLPGRWQQLP